mmetsp:Transcript_37261/g.58137  ORF Transcript_37261/g.58137 Transcript_37261/m.58137 type:complete len:700 (-) Transcript_37261:11-2110(-)
MADNKVDHSTQSNFHEATHTHIDLNWLVDFEEQTLSGFALYKVQIKTAGAKTIVLDTKNLVINKVESEGAKLEYSIGAEHEIFGQALTICLPEGQCKEGAEIPVHVFYSTTPNSTSIQWLSKEKTAGKEHPYLFTQGQAINNRSLVPCQDLPAAKFTYAASVRAPAWSTVVMSALARGSPQPYPYRAGLRVHEWHQPVAISSYLLAIAVGHLESREISARCRVWAEPSVVGLAASDYSQTEEFLQAAEGLTCPYLWGRYDLLCLPPSFPYGGMENPCLTFMTPTTLTGDKSLADVVAHEISHSWTGNLVTNYTWEHFWLNEGWTMWLQRKIMTKIHNKELFFDFDAKIGRNDLRSSITNYGEDHEFTKLIPSLREMDPDDAFSSVPYEKGFALLHYLEKLVGKVPFETFAKAYIERFKFQIITSEDFKSFFLEFFKGNTEVDNIAWEEWFFGPGHPPALPPLDASLSVPSEVLAGHWVKLANEFGAQGQACLKADPTSNKDIKDWAAFQVICFLDILLDEADKMEFRVPVLEYMNKCYGFLGSPNSEIKFRFLSLCLKSKMISAVAPALEMASSVGRMKFVRPLYRMVAAINKPAATKTFMDHKDFYHPICKKMVGKDLGVEESLYMTPKPPVTKKQAAPSMKPPAATATAAVDNPRGKAMAGESSRSALGMAGGVLLGALAAAAVAGAALALLRRRRG